MAEDKKIETYTETSKYLEELKDTLPYYKDILLAFDNGTATAELRKRFMLKNIDEKWIEIIEDTLPSIDTIIRNPGIVLQEKEELLPVELTRKLTSRSVTHLLQHTDLINEIKEDGTVFPSKLLNVYQDDTIATYENRFINTLLARLYGFVMVRIDAAEECGVDTKNTNMKLEQKFEHNQIKGKIKLEIEISEDVKGEDIDKNYIFTSDLWKRVLNIKKVIEVYISSPFIKELGKNYLHPPITRTNKLLKNVDFKKCLDLWEFLESYENTGYETLLQEDIETIDDKCISDMYNAMTAEYVIFNNYVHNSFEQDNVLDSRTIDVFKPEVYQELDPFSIDEYSLKLKKPVGENPERSVEIAADIKEALEIALAVDDFYLSPEEQKKEMRLSYSFMARLIQAQDPVQSLYTEIKNALLKYKDVTCKTTWACETFYLNKKTKIAVLNVRGNILKVCYALDCADYKDTKLKVKDISKQKKFVDIPLMFKIKGDRSLKQGLGLVLELAKKFELVEKKIFRPLDYHKPYETVPELVWRAKPLIKVFNGEVPKPEPKIDNTPVYRYSYEARLILADEAAKGYYSQVKNAILCYEDVKDKITWDNETFRFNHEKQIVLNVSGSTVYVYFALDPKDYADTTLKVKDVHDKKKFVDTPTLIKVKSDRSLKHATILIEELMTKLGANKNNLFKAKNYHRDYIPEEGLARMDPPLVKLVRGILPDYELKNEPAKDNGPKVSYSFMARLIQSEDIAKELYSDLKNYLLSFDCVKARTSWGSETFRYKRDPIAQVKVRGKAVTLFINANVNEFTDIKTRLKDRTKKDGTVPKFASQIKIKSERSLNDAKRVIASLMSSKEIAQLEIQNIDYKPEYKSYDELIALPTPLINVGKKSE